MEEVKKLAKINIVILFISCLTIIVWLRLTSPEREIEYGLLFLMAISISFQILVNLILSAKIFSKDPEKKKWGKAYLLNCLIILLIGFPTCIAGTSFNFLNIHR